MWELIRTNKRNSVMLMTVMALVLGSLGLLIGYLLFGPSASGFGLLIAFFIWLILALVSYYSGDSLLLAASHAKPVTHDVHAQLFNIVDEMRIAAGLPMPKVYIIDSAAPNAFATGRDPEHASLAVTAGLLAKLDRDELQGVVAHEMSHILHRDILYVTLAGIMLGAIVLLSQGLLRGMFYSSLGSNRRYSGGRNRNTGQGAIIMLVLAIVAAILAPIMAQLLYFALSRQREYLADAGAARLTRYPQGLADALEKIANDKSKPLETANKATAPMYIVNPLKAHSRENVSLTSTHPPIFRRIQILRGMAAGASYNDYSAAFKQTTGSNSPIPVSALKEEEVLIRGPQKTAGPKTRKEQIHQVGDIIRAVNGFAFMTCACGVKFKIPPDFKNGSFECPRCGSTNKLS